MDSAAVMDVWSGESGRGRVTVGLGVDEGGGGGSSSGESSMRQLAFARLRFGFMAASSGVQICNNGGQKLRLPHKICITAYRYIDQPRYHIMAMSLSKLSTRTVESFLVYAGSNNSSR